MPLVRRASKLGVMGAAIVAMALAAGLGQEARDRDRMENREAGRDQPRVRQGERRRGQGEEATEDGLPARLAPRLVPPRDRIGRWRLGVFALNTDTGVRITRVVHNSPAWRAGLEANDSIVTVDGYQIGYVDGRLYDLASELQHRADAAGRVLLLVHNHRNGELVPMEVPLERIGVAPAARPTER